MTFKDELFDILLSLNLPRYIHMIINNLFIASSKDYLLIFTDDGNIS